MTAGRSEVAKFQNLAEARVVVGYLQAHGIDAELADAHMHSVLPGGLRFLGGYRITAPDDQIAEARALLDAAERGEASAEE